MTVLHRFTVYQCHSLCESVPFLFHDVFSAFLLTYLSTYGSVNAIAAPMNNKQPDRWYVATYEPVLSRSAPEIKKVK